MQRLDRVSALVPLLCTLLSGCAGRSGAGSAAILPVVAAGFETTCVKGTNDQLTCYGLSVGSSPEGVHTTPVTPSGIAKIKAVALSAFSRVGCAIVGDPSAGEGGPVWCWAGAGAPSQIQGLPDVIKISVGGPGACAIVASDRSVRCWGLSASGGPETFASIFFPQAPSSVRALPNDIADLSVGAHFACAVNATTGQVFCWGRNDAGQLGRGTIGAPTDPELDGSVPVTNLRARKVAAGDAHACAIAGDDTIKCWGQADFGQLGNGVNANPQVPTPQLVAGISNAVNVSAGRAYTCATLLDQTARCWGQNLPTEPNAGTLGAGLLVAEATVGPPPGVVFKKPQAVSVPVPVQGLMHAVFISAGITHACASGFGAMVRCWGTNDFGELADGTTTGSLVPVPK